MTNEAKIQAVIKTARTAFYNAKNAEKFLSSARLDAWQARYETLKEKIEADGGRVISESIREAIA